MTLINLCIDFQGKVLKAIEGLKYDIKALSKDQHQIKQLVSALHISHSSTAAAESHQTESSLNLFATAIPVTSSFDLDLLEEELQEKEKYDSMV